MLIRAQNQDGIHNCPRMGTALWLNELNFFMQILQVEDETPSRLEKRLRSNLGTVPEFGLYVQFASYFGDDVQMMSKVPPSEPCKGPSKIWR